MLNEGHKLGEPQRLFEEIDVDMVCVCAGRVGRGFVFFVFFAAFAHTADDACRALGGRVARQVRRQGLGRCAAHQGPAAARGPRA